METADYYYLTDNNKRNVLFSKLKGINNVNAAKTSLNSLSSGESGKISGIKGSGILKKRLRELGITAGQEVRIIKSAPLDDPIEIKIRNYNISLRREEADKILIAG